jgi:hypothetical protein
MAMIDRINMILAVAGAAVLASTVAKAQTHDIDFPQQMAAVNYVAAIQAKRTPITNEALSACMAGQGFQFCDDCQIFRYSGGPCREDKTWGRIAPLAGAPSGQPEYPSTRPTKIRRPELS